jgi:hypothetical protein
MSRHSELEALRTDREADAATELRARRRAAIRTRQRHRRAVVVCALIVAFTLVGADLARGGDGLLLQDDPVATPAAQVAPQPRVEVPAEGSGAFSYAAGSDQVLGAEGAVQRYRVAIENETGYDVATFAGEVDAILGDPRGWTADHQRRFQRVAQSAPAEFTVFLATPGTVDKKCADGGFHTERVRSCRLPTQLIINLDRWQNSMPDYGAGRDEFRAFAINHELGHQLGYGHEACSMLGAPAPVMMPQTLGLNGCVGYGWPYRDGSFYQGVAVP